MTPTPAMPRLARAVVFALACVGMAAAAHVLAHGQAPPARVAAMATALLTVAALPLMSLRSLPGAVPAAMIGTQAALHTLFCWSTTAAPMPAMPGMHGGDTAIAPWHSSPIMITGHVLAALAAAWWLRRCDDAVSTAVGLGTLVLTAAARALAARVLPRLVTCPRPATAPRVAIPRTRHAARPPSVLLRHAVVLRGPPAAAHR